MITDRIQNILIAVHQRVQTLIQTDRFYVALYDAKNGELSFPFVNEGNTHLPEIQEPWEKRTYDPKLRLVDHLISDGENIFLQEDIPLRLKELKLKYWPGTECPYSWLGVPLKVNDQAIGALVVERWKESRSFNQNDQELLTTFARQAAIAITNARLHDDLERKVENLRILNKSAQQLTRGLVKEEDEILRLLYQGATDLRMDTRNMYIAFYEPDSEDPDTESEIHGLLRFALAYENGQPIAMPDRPAMDGLTGVVIQNKRSFNPANVKETHDKFAVTHRRRIPRSWLGVPMLSEGQVFGVIILRDYERESTYSNDDQEMLEILAGQAAVALQNLRLFQMQQREHEKRKAAESMVLLSGVAAEFAHKMNNLAGTIPVRIGLAKEQLASNNPDKIEKTLDQLTKIEMEAEGLLNAAKIIRQNSETAPDEEVDVNALIEIALARAQNNRTGQIEVNVILDLAAHLPKIMVPRNAFLDTLTSIIKNGFESLDKPGSVTVKTRRTKLTKLYGQDAIEITVKDRGRGIPSANLPKIFDLFFTTKGDAGLGFGLWRDKIVIVRLGGEIDVQSQEGEGSTFIVRIPTNQYKSGLGNQHAI